VHSDARGKSCCGTRPDIIDHLRHLQVSAEHCAAKTQQASLRIKLAKESTTGLITQGLFPTAGSLHPSPLEGCPKDLSVGIRGAHEEGLSDSQTSSYGAIQIKRTMNTCLRPKIRQRCCIAFSQTSRNPRRPQIGFLPRNNTRDVKHVFCDWCVSLLCRLCATLTANSSPCSPTCASCSDQTPGSNARHLLLAQSPLAMCRGGGRQ
jgi:hypothetical protein